MPYKMKPTKKAQLESKIETYMYVIALMVLSFDNTSVKNAEIVIESKVPSLYCSIVL